MKTFELGYSIHDNGDGSVSVHFFKDLEEAQADEEKQSEEEYGTHWGESCANRLALQVDENGDIYFVREEWYPERKTIKVYLKKL